MTNEDKRARELFELCANDAAEDSGWHKERAVRIVAEALRSEQRRALEEFQTRLETLHALYVDYRQRAMNEVATAYWSAKKELADDLLAGLRSALKELEDDNP